MDLHYTILDISPSFSISRMRSEEFCSEVHANRLRNDSATILNNAGQAVKTSCRNSLNLDNTKV